MKKILMIAPDSFPLNGAESIVNLKLLKALSNDGRFNIDLVSKQNKNIEYGQNSLEELGIRLNSLNVVEVDNKINIKTIWGHFMCLLTFGVVFKGSHWAYSALGVVKKLVKENKYDYVLTKNLAAPLLGCYLKRQYKLKWVATWNDPYPDCLYPSVYAKMLGAKNDFASKKLVGMIRRYTDINIFPSTRLREHLLPYYGVSEDKTVIIPHVINEVHEVPPSKHSTLRIIHSGRLAYPRDPRIFFEGLKKFIDRNREAQIAVDLLGSVDNNSSLLISELGLAEIVHLKSPVSYKNSLEILEGYDIALIIEANCKGVFLPTKVSDFMQESKAIFAISPKQGVLNDLYVNSNIPYFADNTDSDSVYDELVKIYGDFKNNDIKKCVMPKEYMENYIASAYFNF